MGGVYANASELLDDAIDLAFALARRQVMAYAEAGLLPRASDEFTGTYVSLHDVRTLLDGGRAATPTAAAQIAELDAAIATGIETIEAGLAGARELPLAALVSTLGLSRTERLVLFVMLAIETNPRMRQVMRYVVNDATRLHADFGVLELLVYRGQREAWVCELSLDAPLFRYRLCEPAGRGQEPFQLRGVKLASCVVEAAVGIRRLDPEVATFASLIESPARFDRLELPPEIKAHAVALVADAVRQRGPLLLVQGPDGSGRSSLVEGAAAALGLRVLVVRCAELPREALERAAQAIGREATLAKALIVLDGIDQLVADHDAGRPDRTLAIERGLLDHHAGPIAAIAPRSDARPARLARGFVAIELGVPAEHVRASLWRRAIGDVELADRAAARYPVTGGVIARAAASAMLAATTRGTAITAGDVHAGVRVTLDAKLSNLGVRIEWRQRWDDLVLPDDALQEVKEFIARVRHKRRVYDEWGFGPKVAKGLGLSALFSGPPGTGKTMVAGLIADALALDLYQIDLSRIVSKYVGETEKNLAGLFDAAEAGHAVLLFDEADSLFAKRTDVKSSVDRYANLEVNYLLQRMEQFAGITILTTNLDTSIDDAFRRRLSLRIAFPMPEAEERERLWRAMMPHEAAVDAGIDYETLADRFVMSGGYIKNAVVRAAFLAADEQGSIGMQHLMRAGNLEYAAMGKVMHGVR